MAAGLVPYAESVRTNSLEQVAQIATLLMASGGRLPAARTQGIVSPSSCPGRRTGTHGPSTPASLVASFREASPGTFMGIHMGGGLAVEANSAPR
jgi:hypothetical protein